MDGNNWYLALAIIAIGLIVFPLIVVGAWLEGVIWGDRNSDDGEGL